MALNLKTIVVHSACWYAGVCAVAYLTQNQLLYHPAQHTLAQGKERASWMGGPHTNGTVLEDTPAVVLEPADPAAVRGTAILFHGNAGAAVGRAGLYAPFAQRGYRLVIAEYPGFGWRTGSPSEEVLVKEGQALYRAVTNGLPKSHPVIVVGESLGTGVAVQVAATAPVAPAALVLLTPYANLREVGIEKLPVLPVRWLMRDVFASDEHIQHFSGPVSVLVAGQDEVLGAETGRALFRAAQKRGPTRLLSLPQAGHNNWSASMNSEAWDQLLGPPLAAKAAE